MYGEKKAFHSFFTEREETFNRTCLAEEQHSENCYFLGFTLSAKDSISYGQKCKFSDRKIMYVCIDVLTIPFAVKSKLIVVVLNFPAIAFLFDDV